MFRLYRYIFRDLASPTVLGLLIYTFVLLMNAIFDVAEFAIKKDLPITAVLKILALSLPQFLTLTIPMSVLLGVLIGVGRLSADSEIIAMRACGIGYWKVVIPVMTLGLVGWAICSSLLIWIEPEADYLRHRLGSRLVLKSDLRKELKSRTLFEEIPGMLLYADKVYSGGSSLERVILSQSDPQGRDLLTTARRGRLDYDTGTGRLRLFLEDGVTHRTNPSDPLDYQVYGADRQMALREPDSGFKLRTRLLKEPQQKNYREQSLQELRESWAKAGALEHIPTRDRLRASIDVVWHERFALPVACLVFSFVGFPLGIYNRRGGKSSGIAISLGVVLVYWLILTTGEQLATENKLPPLVALWTGNLVFVIFGVLLLRRKEKQETGMEGSGWIGRSYAAGRKVRVAVAGVLKRRGSGGTEGGTEPIDPEPRRKYSGGPAFSTLLDRYVLRSYLRFLLMTGLSIYVIFLVVDFRELIDDVINSRVPGTLVLNFFKYRSPWIIGQILPVACLVSTLLAFGVLSRFNEITAMKAGGLSLYRISLPVLGATIVVSTFAFGLQGYVMPFSNQRASQLRDQIRGKVSRSYSQPQKRWVQGTDGVFYSYRSFQKTSPGLVPLTTEGVFQGFSILRLDPETYQVLSRVYAREAQFVDGSWMLRSGWERGFDEGGHITSFDEFKEKAYPLPINPSRFMGDTRTPDQMSYTQLREFIEDLRRRGYSVQELMVDLHEKVAMPFVSFVMVVLGLPF
ncbi:MAG TPA: LptF/LptG family permease, partial [Candidatus Polarisedimenticolia bacterium]|nr:LptF/LptG family permease [Candidatus Polarisedimenticolia bacterium]